MKKVILIFFLLIVLLGSGYLLYSFFNKKEAPQNPPQENNIVEEKPKKERKIIKENIPIYFSAALPEKQKDEFLKKLKSTGAKNISEYSSFVNGKNTVHISLIGDEEMVNVLKKTKGIEGLSYFNAITFYYNDEQEELLSIKLEFERVPDSETYNFARIVKEIDNHKGVIYKIKESSDPEITHKEIFFGMQKETWEKFKEEFKLSNYSVQLSQAESEENQ